MAASMSREEREAFLADPHVGVISIEQPDRAPLTVPVWYRYTPGGELQLITDGDSRKARYLRDAGRFSLCVQSETPPYSYVSVEGPVLAMEAVDIERDVRPLAQRYLGVEGGDQYMNETEEWEGTILVRMRPRYWHSYSGA